jgi:hypothetical protein
MKYIAAAAAFFATLIAVGVAAVFAVLAFAGPHSDTLPQPLQIALYVLCWVAVIALPLLAARAAWRRTAERRVA